MGRYHLTTYKDQDMTCKNMCFSTLITSRFLLGDVGYGLEKKGMDNFFPELSGLEVSQLQDNL